MVGLWNQKTEFKLQNLEKGRRISEVEVSLKHGEEACITIGDSVRGRKAGYK